MVTYGADKDLLCHAGKDLGARHPDARIASLIVRCRGGFSLMTTFIEGGEELVKIVAVGKASLLEG